VFAEPADLNRDELLRVLREGWGIEVDDLRYEPVGFGTHHYRARDGGGGDWFVNVDEIAAKVWLGTTGPRVIGALEKAFGTAGALRGAGLEFVHAPQRRVDWGYVAELAGGYAVSVVPFIDGTSYPFGEFPDGAERREVLAALGRVHRATGAVPPRLPARAGLDVPRREELHEALRNLGTQWTGGPYAEPARELLGTRAGAIGELFDRYDALVPGVLSTSEDWVVTHGEPHAGNVMHARDGGMRLIDWDTVALAPRERDLWMIEPRDDGDRAAYGGAPRVDPAAIELYRLRWKLADISSFAVALRAPHGDDADTRLAWRELGNYLAEG
jgi:spectinomycin phosphotransferase